MNNQLEKIKGFEDLLKLFRQLPKTKARPQTVLEISGYPHFENVCSNILEFFLNPGEEHGLEEVVLHSLLSLVDPAIEPFLLKEVEVEREASTATGKLLDIVVQNENLVVGIENKIHAAVYNDLRDYSDHLEKLAKSTGRPPVKIILCLKKECLPSDHGFRSISYEQFAECLLKNIGPKIPKANPRLLSLLLDFLATIENQKHGTHMNDQMLQFFKDHSATACELYTKTEELVKELRGKTKEFAKGLQNMPKDVTSFKFNDLAEGILHSTVYCDLKVSDDLTIALDARITPEGWQIYAFTRNDSPTIQVSKSNSWLKSRGIKPLRSSEQEWVYAEFKFGESVEVVRKKFEELANKIHAAIKAT